MVLGGGLCLISHTAIFNPIPWLSLLFSVLIWSSAVFIFQSVDIFEEYTEVTYFVDYPAVAFVHCVHVVRFRLCVFHRNFKKVLLSTWHIFVSLLVMGPCLLKVMYTKFLHCEVSSCHSNYGGYQVGIFQIHPPMYISCLEFCKVELFFVLSISVNS